MQNSTVPLKFFFLKCLKVLISETAENTKKNSTVPLLFLLVSEAFDSETIVGYI